MFRDRVEAGRALGRRLREQQLDDPVILGLPRGGVVVAAEVADELAAPLDVLVARKLGVPRQPELAFGAVAPGIVALREDVVHAAGITTAQIDDATARESAKLAELAERYRGGEAPIRVRGRTAIVVDDGLATGATATAAVRSIRREGPTAVIVAVPVCAAETAHQLRREVDELFCLGEYRDFHAVGMYYEEFAAVSDDQVRELIARSRRAPLGR
jgi:putative phosphoribosyl transferase